MSLLSNKTPVPGVRYQYPGSGGVETSPDTSQYIYAMLDAADHVLLWVDPQGNVNGRFSTNAEGVTARGSAASLAARLAGSMTAQGMPITGYAGAQYLRETPMRIMKRKLAESVQLVIACIGDSWTHGRTRWVEPMTQYLQTAYGNSGVGWVGFGNNGGSLPNDAALSSVTVGRTGTWDYSVYYTAQSADLGSAQSSTVGSRITIAVPAMAGATGTLHYIGSAGSVRYSTDGGTTWVATIALTGSGPLTSALTLPATAHSLVLDVVTGPVQLCGVDLRSAADGVRVHKLGSTGSTAQQWSATNNSAALTSLAPNLVIVMLATNDQGGSRTASQFKADLVAITARIKTALPRADILFICPCENNRVANTFPMTIYAAEMEKVALLNMAAYINLQYSFGTTPAEYAFGSARPWMAADLIHPDPTSGGRAILADVVRIIEVQ